MTEHTDPTDPGFVWIERASGQRVAFGPYPSLAAAEHALKFALLIDGECERDAHDAWASTAKPVTIDVEHVVIDVDDPHHTGSNYPVPTIRTTNG